VSPAWTRCKRFFGIHTTFLGESVPLRGRKGGFAPGVYAGNMIRSRLKRYLILLATSCSLAGAAVTGHAVESDGSRIRFDATEHDFGSIMDVSTYDTVFRFANTGVAPLVIEQVKAGCGCTTPALEKKVFAPGESSEIAVTFKPRGGGRQTKRITVFTNDPVEPTVTLSIKADITPFVTATPKMVRFQNARTGAGQQAVVRLEAIDPEFSIRRAYVTGLAAKYFGVQVLPRPEGITTGPRNVLVSLSPEAPWGMQYATLNLDVNGRPEPGGEPVSHTAKVTVNAKVSGTLSANATMFQVGIVEPGETFSKTVVLRHTQGKPFNVLGVAIDRGTVDDMRVEFMPAPDRDDSWLLVLTGTPARTEQAVRGEVEITTDVDGEEEISMRIGGMARAGSDRRAPATPRPAP